MLEGHVGDTRARFNLGEIMVTRCSVSLGKAVGHACVQGRDKNHALRGPVLDALMQGAGAVRIQADILTPLQAEAARTESAAATRVEFFTLMRGEDG